MQRQTKTKRIMTNLEKLHLNNVKVSLHYCLENLQSLDLLQIRNIMHLLINKINEKQNEKSEATNRK